MSAELIGILSVGVALAALHMASIRSLREEIRKEIHRLDVRLDRLETRLDGMESRLDSLEQRMDIVFAVGQYNMVSMALNSFGVQLDEHLDLPPLPVR